MFEDSETEGAGRDEDEEDTLLELGWCAIGGGVGCDDDGLERGRVKEDNAAEAEEDGEARRKM